MNIKRYRYFAVNLSTKIKTVANFAYPINSFRNDLNFHLFFLDRTEIADYRFKAKKYHTLICSL